MQQSQHMSLASLIGSTVFEQLEYLLRCAVELRASDVHIDMKESAAEILLRIQGGLMYRTFISKHASQILVGRLKVLSGMRLDTNDRSQDGAFRFGFNETIGFLKPHDIHIRSATAPTVFGENIVCRIFSNTGFQGFQLDKLGLSEEDEAMLKRILSKDSGLVLVSGPTGSGKTTTLYSCLHHIAASGRMIVTLEDPIEVVLPRIRQVRVQSEYGYGFADALRGVLRQDPDVIMVGEIRDGVTAELAVQAALTGHLVLATIHAPSALEIIDRLHSLGVKSDSCASVINLLMSQRKMQTKDGQKVVFEMIDFNQQFKSALMLATGSNRLSEVIKREGILLLKDRIDNLYYEGLISKDEMNKYAR